MTSVLLVTRDGALLDELSRLAAAAGAAVTAVGEAGTALRGWAPVDLVLVGADLAAELAGLAPPRRPHVFVVVPGTSGGDAFRLALALGADQVVELPSGAGWLSGLMGDLGDERSGPGRLIGVLGGSGGAGATTFACALGQVAARAGPAAVVDTDPLGPGDDRVLGLDGVPGVRWDDLSLSTGRVGARAFREALPSRDGLGVLTWTAGSTADVPAATLREALSAARRGHDVVVVDLPRSAGSVTEELVLRCDLVAVVVRATVASVAAAARVVGRLPDAGRLGLVVRGRGVDHEDLAALTGLPLLAGMTDQRGLVESVDLGLGPVRRRRGPLPRAAADVLAVGVA